MILNFEELIKQFEQVGYQVENDDGWVNVKGRGIRAVFAAAIIGPIDRYVGNRIAADNEHCFDKLSKCPLVMKLPVDWDELQKHLTFLASAEGYAWSNGYHYLDDPKLPREVEP